MSLQEDSLWNSRVFDPVFNDVDGVIIEIVEDNALSNSEVLSWIFNYWLLEETVEFKDLKYNGI